jgi:RHS repeat-associated protein
MYVHVDHLGSTDVLTDAAGTVVERQSYEAFGGRRNPKWSKPFVPAKSKTTLSFTGHEADTELGLINMKGRMYDPELGRFLTPDPIIGNVLDGQRLNAYSYVLNNPLAFVDPTGLDPAGAPPSPPDEEIVVTATEEEVEEADRWKRGQDTGYLASLGAWVQDMLPIGEPVKAFREPQFRRPGGPATIPVVVKEMAVGAGKEYANLVANYARDGVLNIATFGTYGGVKLWSNVIDQAIKGAQYGGPAGAVASVLNIFNPVEHVAEGIAAMGVAAGDGDWETAGREGLKVGVTIAQVVVGGILGGRAAIRGGGSSGLQNGAQAFTAENFRANLGKHTGKMPEGAQAHHVFPQKFADKFGQKGIDIHDPKFGTWWEKTEHGKKAYQYNNEWETFFLKDPSAAEILQFGRDIAGRYGLEVHF